MQLAGTTTRVNDIPPTAPALTPRQEAAQALAAVPVGIATVASFTAMTKSMSGEAASRADLVAPILEKLSPEAAKAAILTAIDGAVALMPELGARSESLRQAAAGIEALLVDIASDHTKGDAQQSLQRVMAPLEPLVTPLMEAALLLDPSFGNAPERG